MCVTFIQLLPTLVSLGVATWAAWTALKGRQASYRIATATLLSSYTELYLQTLYDHPDVLIPDHNQRKAAYDLLKASDRVRVDILAGRLVEVIEAMKSAGDDRARTWLSFLKGFPGPIMGEHGSSLDAYASSKYLKRKIAKLRDDFSQY